MAQTIVLKGLAYGISMLALSDEELSSLLEEIEASDDLMDVEQCVDLYDESYYEYGLLNPKDGYLKITVDGQEKTGVIDALLELEMSTISEINFSSKANRLVLEAYETVDLKLEVEVFDETRLTASVYKITLPNGEVRSIFNPYYDGNEFDQVDATVKTKFRIFTKDGAELDF